ncbi:MAG: GNAT family N-acetyltransferase [Yoonia sp.]|nr:GNAT family N-acetyltransferase [Yoonia sp.]
MITSTGIPPHDYKRAAELYWEAFGTKLGKVMQPEVRALAFIEAVMDGDHAICAHDAAGNLLGVAGFKTYEGALVHGAFVDLVRAYGVIGACWRALFLTLLERDTENRRFLMDGIFVAPEARGKGVGSTLLRAIKTEAKRRGYQEVRLDVIDTNARARALYERMGFVQTDTQSIGLLRFVYGFRAASTMVATV